MNRKTKINCNIGKVSLESLFPHIPGPISSTQFPNIWPYFAFENWSNTIISVKGKLPMRQQWTPLALWLNAHRWAALAPAAGMWQCLYGSYCRQTLFQAFSANYERGFTLYVEKNQEAVTCPGSHRYWPMEQTVSMALLTATKLGINVEGSTFDKNGIWSWLQWHTPVFPVSSQFPTQLPKRLRREDHRFKFNLGNTAKFYF